MKKIFLILLLFVGTVSMFSFTNFTTDSKSETKTEYRITNDESGIEKCEARSCVYTSDPFGNEYKRCTEWEEVPCEAIVPAKEQLEY